MREFSQEEWRERYNMVVHSSKITQKAALSGQLMELSDYLEYQLKDILDSPGNEKLIRIRVTNCLRKLETMRRKRGIE